MDVCGCVCGWCVQNPDLLVAMRDIKKGEEITYDYVQTECHPDFLLAEKVSQREMHMKGQTGQ